MQSPRRVLCGAVDWTVYLALWSVAVAALSIPYKITLSHGVGWGLLAWGAYFGVLECIYRVLGYRRGIRDVP